MGTARSLENRAYRNRGTVAPRRLPRNQPFPIRHRIGLRFAIRTDDTLGPRARIALAIKRVSNPIPRNVRVEISFRRVFERKNDRRRVSVTVHGSVQNRGIPSTEESIRPLKKKDVARTSASAVAKYNAKRLDKGGAAKGGDTRDRRARERNAARKSLASSVSYRARGSRARDSPARNRFRNHGQRERYSVAAGRTDGTRTVFTRRIKRE